MPFAARLRGLFVPILLAAMPLRAAAVGEAFRARCASAKAGQGLVRILHFGDSHLAAPSGQGSFARHLHQLCGSGGAGFGLPWVFPRAHLKAQASPGWRKSARVRNPVRLGLSGGQMETSAPGEWASLEGEFSRVRIYGMKVPGGGRLHILIEGQIIGTLDFEGTANAPALFQADVPFAKGRAGSMRKLELRTVRAGRCLVTGVSLESATGVVYSPIAFNGARASWLLEVPDSSFRAQLGAEAPDLIILSFGTNEANTAPFLAEPYQKSLDELLARLMEAAPRARILLTGPPDGHLRTGVSSNLEAVISIQQSLAARHKALFVDQRQAMGGEGAIDAWAREGLANRDLLHLTSAGYERLSIAVLRPLFPGQDLTAYPVTAPFPGSPRGPVPAPEERQHWLYWVRAENGRLIITDDLTRYPGLKVEKKTAASAGN